MRRDYVDRSLAGIAGPPTVDLATITSGTSGPAVGAAPFGERTLVCYSTADTNLPIARFGPAVVGALRSRLFFESGVVKITHMPVVGGVDGSVATYTIGVPASPLFALVITAAYLTGWAGRKKTSASMNWADGYQTDVVRLEAAGRLFAWPKALTDTQVLAVMAWLAVRYSAPPPRNCCSAGRDHWRLAA